MWPRCDLNDLEVVLGNGMLCPHFEFQVSDAVPSLWLCAWRKARDLLPPLPSSGLRTTVNSHRSVCPLSSLFCSKAHSRYWKICPEWFQCLTTNIVLQNLRVKLTTIVEQRETYHPFLMSFSFSRLLETVQSYLDAYLKKYPSDYLLKVQDLTQCVGGHSLCSFEFNHTSGSLDCRKSVVQKGRSYTVTLKMLSQCRIYSVWTWWE